MCDLRAILAECLSMGGGIKQPLARAWWAISRVGIGSERWFLSWFGEKMRVLWDPPYNAYWGGVRLVRVVQ